MAKRFIRTTSTNFNNLSDKSEYNDSLVFIEDINLIWSNGKYYGRVPLKGVDYFNEEDKAEFVEDMTPIMQNKIEEMIGDVDLDGDATSIDYTSDIATTYLVTNVSDALDKLFNKVYFTPLQFNNFSPTKTQINEKGYTPNIEITWSFNKTPEKLYDGDTAIDVQTTSIIKTPTNDTTYTIKGVYTDLDNKTKEVAKSVSCKFYNRLFYKDITDRDLTDEYTPQVPTDTEGIQLLGVNGDTKKTEWSVFTSKTETWLENKVYQTGSYNGKKLCIAIPTSQTIKSMITSANDSILDQMEKTYVNYKNGDVTTNYTIYTLTTNLNLEIDFIKITFN